MKTNSGLKWMCFEQYQLILIRRVLLTYTKKMKEIGNAEKSLIPNIVVLCNLLIVKHG